VVTGLAVRNPSGPAVRRWSDLLSLPAKAVIGLKDAETSGSAYATYYLLRDQYGYSFWQRLAARPTKIYRNEEEMVDALVRGEADVLAGLMAEPATAGKHVRIVWPADGAPIVVGPVAILAAAPHPNAAKLLVDFLLSAEGQTLMRNQTGDYPAREGISPPKSLPPLSELAVLRPRTRWELYTAMQDTLQAEYHDFFRPSSE
jgi:iron(III) transport system substrate-binding protein